MRAPTTIEIRTFLYGLGGERQAAPNYVPLHERKIAARDLVAAHVRAEIARTEAARRHSLALHYLLADDVRRAPVPPNPLDIEAEIRRAWAGLSARRYLLTIDGDPVDDLDAPLTLHERSLICFLRLVPLAGG